MMSNYWNLRYLIDEKRINIKELSTTWWSGETIWYLRARTGKATRIAERRRDAE